jgi:hypothetical protein
MNTQKNKFLSNAKFPDTDRRDFHNVLTVAGHAEGIALYKLGNDCGVLNRMYEPVFGV